MPETTEQLRARLKKTGRRYGLRGDEIMLANDLGQGPIEPAPPEEDMLTELTRRVFGPKAEFWQSKVKPPIESKEFRSEYEPTLAPGEKRSLPELEAMLAGVIEAGGMMATPLPGISGKGPKLNEGAARVRKSRGNREVPMDFASRNLEKLKPEERSKLLDKASDSELRFALHTTKMANDIATGAAKGKLAKKGIGEKTWEQDVRERTEAQHKKNMAAERDKEMTSMLLKLSPEDVAKAEASAKRTAQLWTRMGVPFSQSFPEAFHDAVKSRLGFDKQE